MAGPLISMPDNVADPPNVGQTMQARINNVGDASKHGQCDDMQIGTRALGHVQIWLTTDKDVSL
jgi:hypothetical protein